MLNPSLKPLAFAPRCPVVPLLTNIFKCILYHSPASIDRVVCYSFFLWEFSSALGFYHPWHQGKSIITQQEIVQIWPSIPQWFSGGSPKVPSSIVSLKSLFLICASDEDPLDHRLTQRSLYFASTRARSTREKKPL